MSPDPVSMGMQIVGLLVRARQTSGATQGQVAERMGVTRWHFCKIENGHRHATLDQACAWASAVGVELRAEIARLDNERAEAI